LALKVGVRVLEPELDRIIPNLDGERDRLLSAKMLGELMEITHAQR
jgi:hypothetical protein